MIGGARLMSLYQRAFPPPIPSAYAANPRFAKVFEAVLTDVVQHYQPKILIEFGVAHGFSTAILAKAMPAAAKLYAYDLFDQVSAYQVLCNLKKVGAPADRVEFIQKNVWYWLLDPTPFDFLYLDAAICETLIEMVYEKLHRQDRVIIYEGANRIKPAVPVKFLTRCGPGIGMLT